MSSEIQICAAKVRSIANAPIDDVADALYTLAGLEQRIKELRAEAEAVLLERLKESGDFRVGDMLYTLAKPKKVKVRDVNAATGKLLEVTGGDLDKFCGCLAANAFKHGTVKRVLEELGAAPETFDELFETTFEEEVKVTKVNLQFAK